MAHRSIDPKLARAAYAALTSACLVAMALPESARAQSPIDPGMGTKGPGGIQLDGPTPSPGASGSPAPSATPPAPPGDAITPPPDQPDTVPKPEPTGTPNPNKVRVRADRLINERATGITTFRGNVHVDYGPTTIDAEELGVDSRNKVVFTDVRFELTQPDEKNAGKRQIVTGTGLRYNYETKEATLRFANVTTPAEATGQTIYVRAKDLHGWGSDRWDASDAVFSTCEELVQEKQPHYHVESKLMQYYAGDKLIAWNNRIYLNGKYVFWLPVAVIPLKREPNSLNAGRNEVEGFYLRSTYGYALPSLNNGYWLNDGHLIANLFEKKPPGVGFEHTARWGYDATTYGFFYGLVQPDRGNFLSPTAPESGNAAENKVRQGQALFGLNGLPFQDHQWGVEHRHRFFGDFEIGGRLEDHNIYDFVSQNYRNNRQMSRFDLKDKFEPLGVTYDFGYDGTKQRGNQSTGNQLAQTNSDRLKGNVAFSVVNTDIRMNSQFDRNQTVQRSVAIATPSPGSPYRVQQTGEEELNTYVVTDTPGQANVNVTNAFTATSRWGSDTNSNLNVPYRITYKENAPATPVPPGSSATPAPTPSPSPWSQQVEPQFDLTHRAKGIGTLQLTAQKFLDVSQPAPIDPLASPTPVPSPSALAAAEQDRIRNYGRFDKLPELTLTSEPIFPDWQPLTFKAGYGRYFEYATFTRTAADAGQPLDVNFPGNYINRFNPEASLNSKGHPIGFKSKLDFGGSGYRQFFYSTSDAQYSIDERVRLTTDWTKSVQTNFNYTNNITPDTKILGLGRGTATNNSPFNQDRLSLSKQTRLTGSLDVTNEPWLRYAFRGGYDYINRQYDNLSSEATWRTQPLGIPIGLTLNGQYEIDETPEGGLNLEKKTFDIAYLPKFPTFGIAGKWLPVTGTLAIRSTPEVFGGAFGGDKIVPGWQFDSMLGYDFNTGLWQTLSNRLYFIFGDHWTNHLELMLGGYYNTAEKQYKFAQIGLSKDLHDFVLSFQYDSLQSFYSLNLTMIAFPSQPLNFTSNTFDRRTGAGGGGFGSSFPQ